jgi:hypothetical protein
MDATLKSAWRGDWSLGASFWGLFVLGGFIATLLGGVIVFGCRQAGLLGLGWAIGGGGWLLWQIFSVAAVWNSALRKKRSAIWLDRLSAYAAMVIVFLFSARLTFGLINGGAFRFVRLVSGSLDLNP